MSAASSTPPLPHVAPAEGQGLPAPAIDGAPPAAPGKVTTRRLVAALVPPLVGWLFQWYFWASLRPTIWLLFAPAVFLSAWIGGFYGGITAIVLSISVVGLVFIRPDPVLSLDHHIVLTGAIFVLLGLGYSVFHERLRRTANRLAATSEALRRSIANLEDNVAERTWALGRLNESLCASEESLSKIFQLCPDGMIVLAMADTEILWVNRSFCRLCGVEETALLGNRLTEFGDRLPPRAWSEIRERLLRDGGCLDYEVEIDVVGNGHPRPFELSTRKVRLEGRACLLGVLRDVGERVAARVALQEGEERLRSLVALMPEAMFVNHEGRIVYINERGLQLWGADCADQIIGRSPFELIEPRWHDLVRQRLGGLLADGGTAPMVEMEIVRLDGTVIPVESSASVFPYGGRSAVQVLFCDISQRKQAELELLESNKGFAAVFNYSPVPTTLTSLDESRYLDVNEAFLNLFQWTREEVVGSTALSLNLWHNLAQRAAFFAELTARGHVENYEMTLCSKQGRPRHLLWSGVIIQVGGQACLLGSGIDVTERKQGELLLAESEAKFRATFDQLAVGMGQLDLQGRWTLANQRLCGLLGYSLAELCEKTYRDITHPDDAPNDEGKGQLLISGGLDTYATEKRYLRKDGTAVPINLTVSIVRDPAGVARYFVAVVEDITERKRIEAQFLKAQRQEAIGCLSSGIAHDLNNILTPMQLVTQMLSERLSAESDRQLLGVIESGAARGASIIRQLLAFSRGIDGDRSAVEVPLVVAEIANIIRETFPRDIVLAEQMPANLWQVTANATQIYQVLMNLCVNARDAMASGGRLTLAARNVTVEASDGLGEGKPLSGEFLRVSVADTGQGIPSELLGRIFEPFFTTKGIGKGSGLGLSTVLGIVRTHGGAVKVDSRPGCGSEFSIYLPRRTIAAAPAQPLPVVLEPGNKETVLLIDDEHIIRHTVSRFLVKHNYRVVVASDAAEGMRRFLENRSEIQLVITDLMMPGENGASLSRTLREIAPALPILVMSGMHDDERKSQLDELGIADVLAKPFSPSQVLAAVRKILSRG